MIEVIKFTAEDVITASGKPEIDIMECPWCKFPYGTHGPECDYGIMPIVE